MIHNLIARHILRHPQPESMMTPAQVENARAQATALGFNDYTCTESDGSIYWVADIGGTLHTLLVSPCGTKWAAECGWSSDHVGFGSDAAFAVRMARLNAGLPEQLFEVTP